MKYFQMLPCGLIVQVFEADRQAVPGLAVGCERPVRNPSGLVSKSCRAFVMHPPLFHITLGQAGGEF